MSKFKAIPFLSKIKLIVALSCLARWRVEKLRSPILQRRNLEADAGGKSRRVTSSPRCLRRECSTAAETLP